MRSFHTGRAQGELPGRAGILQECWEGIWELPTPTVCIMYSLGAKSSLPTLPALTISLKTQHLFVLSPRICFYGKGGCADPAPSNAPGHRITGGTAHNLSHITPITQRVWNTVEGKIFTHINVSTFSMGKGLFHQGKVLAHSLSWKGERRVAGFCRDCKSESH